ncbi:hypothetical protein GQ44DRAFT_670352 [Phaeosphaeriaceae sp. PMI808]|nr:hypothetical protein GQ44DRAFT_670352 [Phaeosphaeriaceae sp. PMI808]
MASNNDDSDRNRNRDRPEDNPFIAFRRFADSQVSSLLNTVFTLPATIANHNNAHQAREACLFKKADAGQCARLQEIEHDITGLRHEGRELYRAGDLQEVLKKSEELMSLNRHADELRRDIVAQSSAPYTSEDEKNLMQRVAIKKGQEWGWDWSWGFPKPLDDERRPSRCASDETSRHPLSKAIDIVAEASESSPVLRDMMSEKSWEELQHLMQEARGKNNHEANKWQRIDNGSHKSPNTFNHDYSPYVLEEDRELKKTGINWRKAYEELLREGERNDESMAGPWRGRRREMYQYPKQVPWVDVDTNDEPSYEYSHDHEDQHDDPPTPKAQQGSFQGLSYDSRNSTEGQQGWKEGQTQQTDTELDVYEQILAKPECSNSATSAIPVNANSNSNLSILSTLTTTERTFGPDGSVITKVVLKKRFTDGREENSETVHMHHGKEWETTQNYSKLEEGREEHENKKTQRKGWFWSS